jgi:hypothetical protein
MTNYYPLIARAVEELGRSTGEARQSIYERTRNAVAQLRSNPALSEADIAKECLALEEAIRKVEAEAASNSPRKTCAEPRSAAPSEGITDGERIQSADHSQPASPDRHDRPQPFSSRRVPAFLASASDVPDNADFQAVAIGRAYGADHYYAYVPGSRWRGGVLILMAVLALAVPVGIFVYRGTFGGYVFPALPPILKAGIGSNNIVQNNSDKKYVTSAGSSEKLQPVDISGAPEPVPRVISTIPISSKPSAGAVAPAPTASTPSLVPALASDLDPQVAASLPPPASALVPVPATTEPKEAGAIALATREQVSSMPGPAPPLLTGESVPPLASATAPVPASSEPKETGAIALATREQVPSMPGPAPPVLTGESVPPLASATASSKRSETAVAASAAPTPALGSLMLTAASVPPFGSAPVPVPTSSDSKKIQLVIVERRTQWSEPPPYRGSVERQSGIATVMADPVTLPNPTDVQQQRDQSPTAAAPPSLNERRAQRSEPPPYGGSVERQSGIATVVTDPVTNTNAIMPAIASSPSVSQLERTRTQLGDKEIAALIKRGQDFVRNRDFSSARLLLKRAAEAGSAAAALSLGETFDPLVLQQFHEIGVQPDLAQARDWYERAARLGSDGASQRLAKIAPPP